MTDDSDRTPLHWAASEGDKQKVLNLLEQKVDIDPVDDVGTLIIVCSIPHLCSLFPFTM